MLAKTLLLLIVAAALEVGGDALIRLGLDGAKYWIAVGGLTLFVYGVMVNLTGLDFNRLMGIYIAIFFVVSQAVSWVVFKQIPDDRIILGGGFIVAGGAIMMVMA